MTGHRPQSLRALWLIVVGLAAGAALADERPDLSRPAPEALAPELGTLPGLAPDAGPAAREFGPWEAGPARGVSRQGRAGMPRRRHPRVGAIDHIPAAGPPPPPLRRDPDLPEIDLSQANRVGSSLAAHPLYLAALFYQHVLTKVDGARCQHLPTCSRFANQAVARHGLLGIPLGLARLIQDGHSSALRLMPEVEFAGSTRFFDPVASYAFWQPEGFRAFPPPTEERPLAGLGPVWPPTPRPEPSRAAGGDER